MKLLFPLVCASLLAGCSTTPDPRYPSLLPRAIEKRSDAEPVAAPVAPAAPDPAIDAKLSETQKALTATRQAFDAAASRAEKSARAAKGDKVGGDHWIAAQTALAELDSYRATTSALVTDLEQIAIDRAASGQPDYPGLEAAREAASESLTAQSARIAAIQAILAPA